jgi:4'-phosphopantetheinyl transferase
MTTCVCRWLLPPSELQLLSDEVHVWSASLDPPAPLVQRLAQLLSLDERLRAERFHFEKDRRRFIVSRAILRTILGRYLKVEPGWLQFRYEHGGKPALVETSSWRTIQFNVSHSQSLALYDY